MPDIFRFPRSRHLLAADYSEAIRLRPDYADAFNNRGCIYGEFKQYDKAIADFSEAIRLKPDLAAVYRNRADGYDAMHKKVEAKRDRACLLRPQKIM